MVKALLNSILRVERTASTNPTPQFALPGGPTANQPSIDPTTVIDEVAEAFERADYDRAVYLLQCARASPHEWRFINLDAWLAEAEGLLEEQSYGREAEREYQPIAALVKRERTRQLGCKAFQAFRKQYPNYDPENLAGYCATIVIPMLNWCDIPGGEVMLEYSRQRVTTYVEPFRISKYPITNAQYQVFVDASDGYSNAQWWDFSPDARQWFREHPMPLNPKFAWEDHPRANVCWYEAMAFCHWLSHQIGLHITLPTEERWQWAAQGGDGRVFPWGNRFDPTRCNTSMSKIRKTTPVNAYDGAGDSPFGPSDMAGNVWEWCLNTEPINYSNGNGNGNGHGSISEGVRRAPCISTPPSASAWFANCKRPPTIDNPAFHC